MEKKPQLFLIIISFLVSALSIFVGISLFSFPEKFIIDIDFSKPEIQFLLKMWGARQIAIGTGIMYALFQRSSIMLQSAIFIYSLMNFIDIFIAWEKEDHGMLIGSSFFFLLSFIVIGFLKKNNNEK